MITQTLTTSFKKELLQGVHNFGPTSPDIFKIALYTGTASLNADTTVYTSTNEVPTSAGSVLFATLNNMWVPYYESIIPGYEDKLYDTQGNSQALVGKYPVGDYIPTGCQVTAVALGDDGLYYAQINQNITDNSVYRQETVYFYTSLAGYVRGGNVLTVNPTPTSSGTTAYVSFNSVTWTAASFTAAGALIYNQSKGNKSVAVLNFGGVKSPTAGTFTIQFPTASSTTAIIRIA